MPQHIKITVTRKTLFEDSFQQVLSGSISNYYLLALRVCVCVYTCAYAGILACASKCGSQRCTSSVLFQYSLPCILRQGPSLNLVLTFGLNQLASKPLGLSVFAPLVLGVQACAAIPGSYVGCWEFELRVSSLHRKHLILQPFPQSLTLPTVLVHHTRNVQVLLCSVLCFSVK